MSEQFRILMFLEGRAEVRTSGGSVSAGIGSTVLIPAESDRVVVTPKERVQVLEILCTPSTA